jgi:hypothetical protein
MWKQKHKTTLGKKTSAKHLILFFPDFGMNALGGCQKFFFQNLKLKLILNNNNKNTEQPPNAYPTRCWRKNIKLTPNFFP